MNAIIRSSTLPHRGLNAKSAKRLVALSKRTTVRIDRCMVREMNRLSAELRATKRDLAQQSKTVIQRPVFKTMRLVAPKMLDQVRDYKAVRRISVSR